MDGLALTSWGATAGGKWRVWWIELFPAGGVTCAIGEFVVGSTLEAIARRMVLDGYVFADLNEACAESLRRRVGYNNVRSPWVANSPEHPAAL